MFQIQFRKEAMILRNVTSFLLWFTWVLDIAASLLFAITFSSLLKNNLDQKTEDDVLIQFLYYYYTAWSLIMVLISIIGVKATHLNETKLFDEIFYHFCFHAFKESCCLLLILLLLPSFSNIRSILIYLSLLKIGVLVFVVTQANRFRNLSKNQSEKKCLLGIVAVSPSHSAVDLLRTDLISTRLWKPDIYVT